MTIRSGDLASVLDQLGVVRRGWSDQFGSSTRLASRCYYGSMRTTVTLDQDVAAAVRRLQREHGVGVSQAINGLVRAGLSVKRPRAAFRQRSVEIGLRVDVTNVAEAIEVLDGARGR